MIKDDATIDAIRTAMYDGTMARKMSAARETRNWGLLNTLRYAAEVTREGTVRQRHRKFGEVDCVQAESSREKLEALFS